YERIHADPKHIDDSESILNEVDLEDIRAAFPISIQYTYSLPDGNEPSIAAPLPSTIVTCFKSLRARLRIPIHPFIRQILRLHRLLTCQLVPNNDSILAAYIIMCGRAGAKPSIEAFYSLCSQKKIPEIGYWRFQSKRYMKIMEIRTNVKAWKVKCAYVTSDEWDFGDEVAGVLENLTPRLRAVLNEVEMSLRCTFEHF
ncbi:hypothetical protein Dimus_028914, partial [Dionaea muscipula]